MVCMCVRERQVADLGGHLFRSLPHFTGEETEDHARPALLRWEGGERGQGGEDLGRGSEEWDSSCAWGQRRKRSAGSTCGSEGWSLKKP